MRSSNKVFLAAALLAMAAVFFSCSRAAKAAGQLDVAVFIPGVASGSPIYEMLVAGAQKAVTETPNATIKIIEAGYNQSEWLDRLVAVASSGEFELIVTSNPALPELCAKVAADYPAQKFFIADAYLKDNASIHTVLYNQKEQGYIVGYLAGLVTKEANPNGPLVAGLISAQRYPTMDKLIQPGFEAGLKAVDPSFKLEYREIGNWYDANKAAELAGALYDSGAMVILPIAGGAGQGVIAQAQDKGKKIVWFDGSGYAVSSSTVIGCAVLAQDILVYERVKAILGGNGKLYGRADIVGVHDGYVDFSANGDGYRALSESVRSSMQKAVAELKKGNPDFTLSSF